MHESCHAPILSPQLRAHCWNPLTATTALLCTTMSTRHPPSSVLQLFDNRESRETCEARRSGCATVRGWSSHVCMYPMVLGPFSPSHKSISVATLQPIFRGRTKQLYEKGRREGTARARVAKAKTSSEVRTEPKWAEWNESTGTKLDRARA